MWVNGSVTKDFEVGRGLTQGDPLSPFWLVLAADRLTGIVMKALSVREFLGFLVGEKCEVDILEFADDTLLMGISSLRQA